MNYENNRPINSQHFFIQKMRRSNKSLEYYLDQIKIEDYILIKRTRNFRIINIENIEKYAGVLFIKKDIFNEENFNLWQNWIKNNISIKYLDKPFPDFDPNKKFKEIL